MEYMQTNWGYSKQDSYHFAFGVACISLIVSIIIYFAFRKTFKHADYNGTKPASATSQPVEEISKAETKERIVALCLVFAVVIFFWMAFHQNGSTLTYFAEQYTDHNVTGIETMFYDVWNLVLLIFFGRMPKPENDFMDPIIAKDVTVVGKVRGVFRYLN